MFDMLDEDLDMDYVPTINTNKSRSGGMKKISKKQPKAPAKVQKKVNMSNIDDFDDLLDDFVVKQKKNVSGLTDNKSGNNHLKSKKDSFQFFDDEPKSKSLEKTTKLTIKDDPPPPASPSKNKRWGEISDQIISEDFNLSKNISKPTLTTINHSTNPNKVEKIEQEPVFASSRNMKPPLRKKDSQTSIKPPSVTGGNTNFNLTIPEQPTSLTISSKVQQKQEDSDIIRPPPRLMGRRLSTEMKTEKNEESKLSVNLGSDTLTLGPDKKQSKREESSPGRGLFLTVDEPQNKKKEEKSPFFSFSKQKQPQQSKSLGKQPQSFQKKSFQPKPYQKPRQQLKIEPKKQGLQLKIDQSVTMKESYNMPMSNIVTTKTGVYPGQDFTKQIEMMKNAFQKQIDFLQQNLQRQIKINTQTREKVVNQSNKMIQDQRRRTKKLYQQELKRQKQMAEWQKKRIEDNYKTEIQSLKQNLQYVKQTAQTSSLKTTSSSKEDVSYLELQLKNQKKILTDRQKIIDKRQADLHERQQQLVKRRKRQEERIRDEEKRLMQMQSKIKKCSLDDKKNLSSQKQHMAIQLANLQIESKRKMQRADLSLQQTKQMRQCLQTQKAQLRLANAQLLSKFKQKSFQLQQQKQRIKLIEQQLIKKLRIVEIKSKEVSNTTLNKTVQNRKQNNWVNDRSASQLRAVSVEKHNVSDQSVSYGRGTKERFNQLEANTRNKISIGGKDNKKFDLQNYIMTVEQYNNAKKHA